MVPMRPVGPADKAGHYKYTAASPASTPAATGSRVRVVPAHPDLADPVELGRIVWA